MSWILRTPMPARLLLSSVRQCQCPWAWILCILRSTRTSAPPALFQTAIPAWGTVPEEYWSLKRLEIWTQKAAGFRWMTVPSERTTLEKCTMAWSRWAAWTCSDRAKRTARKQLRVGRWYPDMSPRNQTCLSTRRQSCTRHLKWISSYLWNRILPTQASTEIPRVCGAQTNARTAADPNQKEADQVDIICCVNFVIVGKPLLDPSKNATVAGTWGVSRLVKMVCEQRWHTGMAKWKGTKVQCLKMKPLFTLSRPNPQLGWIARIVDSGK